MKMPAPHPDGNYTAPVIAGVDTEKPGVVFTWPNALLVVTIAFATYLLVSKDTTGLPRYIQTIQALGHCVWLMPFALYYNVEKTQIARRLYVSANLLFVLLIVALSN